MPKKDNRRNFLQKMAAVGSGVFFAVKTGLSNSNPISSSNATTVKNITPLGFQWQTKDPFLFCVHHEDAYPKGNAEMGPNASLDGREIGQDFMIKDGWRMYHGTKVPGFPGHPHRGFETITVVRKGMVDHTDSLGAAGRYGDGDVQWMTSGKGVLHAEMFPLIKQEEENPMELFQIWLNLPKKNKMVDPHFTMLWADKIPTYIHMDNNNKRTRVEVIAGAIDDHIAPSPPPNSWASAKENEVAIWNIQMDPGATWQLPTASKGINRTLYFFKGDELVLDGKNLAEYHAADLDANEPITITNGEKKGYLLILQGRPINEPVVQHGPFVMNTKQEIQQAFHDYQTTQFGGWPWPVWDPVHPATKGRFALHADGKEETKG